MLSLFSAATAGAIFLLLHTAQSAPDEAIQRRQENGQKAYINASAANSGQVVLQVSTKDSSQRNKTGSCYFMLLYCLQV